MANTLPKPNTLQKIAPILITILIAGTAGYALGRSTNGLEARVAASGAALAGQAGCSGLATDTWSVAATRELTIEAHAVGQDCANALALLIVRDGPRVLFHSTFDAANVFSLREAAEGTEDMNIALAKWIDPGEVRTSASLPPFSETADQPNAPEFPFYLAEDMDQATYEAIRAAGAPLWCYVQGNESEACLILEEDSLSDVGYQIFPG
jgi:hypothetical protein